MKKVYLALLFCTMLINQGLYAKETNPIRIATLPILDTLPMHVAEVEGLYIKHGIKVTLIPVASAPERDQLLQSGAADGCVNELLSVLFFNKNQWKLRVIRAGHMANQDSAHFFLLASPNSSIKTPKDIKDKKKQVGIAKGTIIEYVTDKLLLAHGIDPSSIQYINVPKISDRMALLISGQLDTAVLPDPLGFVATQKGCSIIIDDKNHPTIGASVISFMDEILNNRQEDIKKFLLAIEEAVSLINNYPDKYLDLLVERRLIPQSLKASYKISRFPKADVPKEKDFLEVLTWARQKGLLASPIPYSHCVTGAFLP